jgi:hypothetical protein
MKANGEVFHSIDMAQCQYMRCCHQLGTCSPAPGHAAACFGQHRTTGRLGHVQMAHTICESQDWSVIDPAGKTSYKHNITCYAVLYLRRY